MKFEKRKNNFFSFALLLMLIAAIAFTAVGCNERDADTSVTTTSGELSAVDIGEGEKSFVLVATHLDGSQKRFNVKTDKDILGDALCELGVISGEDGPYGLYVKTVDGEFVDYDTHGKYWAFYTDGAYASSGIDATTIESGRTYELRAE